MSDSMRRNQEPPDPETCTISLAVDRALYELAALMGRMHEPNFQKEFQDRLTWNDTLRRRVRRDVEYLRGILEEAAFGEEDGLGKKAERAP